MRAQPVHRQKLMFGCEIWLVKRSGVGAVTPSVLSYSTV